MYFVFSGPTYLLTKVIFGITYFILYPECLEASSFEPHCISHWHFRSCSSTNFAASQPHPPPHPPPPTQNKTKQNKKPSSKFFANLLLQNLSVMICCPSPFP